MKTRIVMIISLVILALALLLGLKIGRKNCDEQKVVEAVEECVADTLIAKRVCNLIILDESGSMDCIREVSVDGVNETFQTIRTAYEEFPQQEQLVTFATFSGSPSHNKNFYRVKRKFQSIVEVTNFTVLEYIPNGVTPLWDTMGELLTQMEDKVTDEDIVLVTIITDGMENSSVKYDSEKIRSLVGRLDEKGWVFTYIGANQDAAMVAGRVGIKNFYQYSSDKEGTRQMFEKERTSRRNFYGKARTETVIHRLKDNYFEDEENK